MAARKSVQMYDPTTDKTVAVAADQIEAAEADGLELETEDSAKRRAFARDAGIGEMLTAAGEGALSGATLGGSDVALSALLGDEYREGRNLRKDTFGGIETASEIAGGVIPILLSGGAGGAAKGAGLLARGARLTPTALAARAAAGAEQLTGRGLARLGLEGESILARAASGGVRLGAGGLVEGGLAGGGFALGEAALADELGSFDKAAEMAWAGAKHGAMFGLFGGAAMGATAGAAAAGGRRLLQRFQRNGDALADSANERALKALDPRGTEVRKLRSEAKVQQIGEDLRNYTLRDGTPLLDWVDNVESLAPKLARARAEVGEELGALRAKVAEETVAADAAGWLRKIDDDVISPLKTSSSPTERRMAKKLESELADMRTRVSGQANDTVTYADLLRQQATIKRVAYPKRAPGQGLPTQPAPWMQELQKVERTLEGTLEEHVETTLAKVAPDDVGKYKDLRRLSESFIKADTIAKKSVGANLGNRAVSLTDYMTGLTAGSALFDGGMSAVGGLGVAFAHKFARERGSALLATLYTRSKSVNRKIDQSFTGFFTRARELREATAGAFIGQPVQYDMGQVLKARANESHEDAYDRMIARATAISNGSAVGPFVIDDEAPNTGHAMRLVQQRAAAHLVKHAPAPPRTSANPNLGALSADMRPDPVKLYEFSRRVRAIEDPTTLLDDLKSGTISVAAVEAVKEVYPHLYADMQGRAVEWLGNMPELMTYESRVRIGLLFELPTDPTLRPEFATAMQALYQQPTPPPRTIPPGSPGRKSEQIQSMSEELETGEVPV